MLFSAASNTRPFQYRSCISKHQSCLRQRVWFPPRTNCPLRFAACAIYTVRLYLRYTRELDNWSSAWRTTGRIYSAMQRYAASMFTGKWIHQTRGTKSDIPDYRHTKGPASLEHMVLRLLMQHLSLLNAETMQQVPWELGKMIWVKAKKQ